MVTKPRCVGYGVRRARSVRIETKSGETRHMTPPSAENELDPESTEYARLVGERLRAIRRQKRLSLQEAEELSGQEFKASVLGAYERGERAISVPRLHRLATVY